MAAAKITSKGQCTIPKSVRDELGVGPGDEIDFVKEDGKLVVKKHRNDDPFAKWMGYAKRLAGRDAVDVIREMRDA